MDCDCVGHRSHLILFNSVKKIFDYFIQSGNTLLYLSFFLILNFFNDIALHLF